MEKPLNPLLLFSGAIEAGCSRAEAIKSTLRGLGCGVPTIASRLGCSKPYAYEVIEQPERCKGKAAKAIKHAIAGILQRPAEELFPEASERRPPYPAENIIEEI